MYRAVSTCKRTKNSTNKKKHNVWRSLELVTFARRISIFQLPLIISKHTNYRCNLSMVCTIQSQTHPWVLGNGVTSAIDSVLTIQKTCTCFWYCYIFWKTWISLYFFISLFQIVETKVNTTAHDIHHILIAQVMVHSRCWVPAILF